MTFLNIKHPQERDAVIEDYLAPKKPLKERNLEERGYLMHRQRDLEGTFEPEVASNQKMTEDIIKDLTPITKGLRVINRNLEAQKEPPRPNIGSKGRFVSDYDALTET